MTAAGKPRRLGAERSVEECAMPSPLNKDARLICGTAPPSFIINRIWW